MKIEKLIPEHFGKFNQKEVSFGEGLNLITAPNESGKTTLCAFLRAMLFGMEKPRGRATKQDMYTRYQPMDTPGAYQGAIELSIDGKRYRIRRVFYQNERKIEMTDLDSGRDIPAPWEVLTQLLPELSESGYCNTVSVPQSGAATDSALAEELQNYIANLSAAKEQEVDVSKALNELTEKAKEIDRKKLPEEAARIEEELKRDTVQLMELDDAAKQAQESQAELEQKKALLAELREEQSRNDESEFAAWAVRYQNYKNAVRELNSREDELTEKENALTPDRSEEIAARQSELTAYRKKEQELNRKGAEIDAQRDAISREFLQKQQKAEATGRKMFFAAGGIGLVGIVLLLVGCLAGVMLGLVVAGAVLFVASAGVLATAFAYKNRTTKERVAQYEEADKSWQQMSEEYEAALSEHKALPDGEEQQAQLDALNRAQAAAESRRADILEQKAKNREILAELEEQKEQLREYFAQFVPMESLSEAKVAEIQGHLLANSANMEQKIADAEQDIDALMRVAAKQEALAERGAEVENRVLEQRRRLEELHTRIREDAQEKEAIELAKKTILKLSEEIHDSFGKELGKRTAAYVKQLTAGAYHSVTVDEKLQLKVNTGSKFVKSDQLSAGTIEQLALAVRLAVGETMYQNYELPLILDDAFAFYDDARLAETLELLAKCGRQVLLFTCQERERRLLKEKKLQFFEVKL